MSMGTLTTLQTVGIKGGTGQEVVEEARKADISTLLCSRETSEAH
jgi:hypothetical protein